MKNEYVFCTLFDSNYLDKGLMTINSLIKYCECACIFVLSMDQKCFDILTEEKINRVNVISLDNFMDEELKEIKKTRGRAEFCWTCTASLIEYILNVYKVDSCTYVDADMRFYSDPSVLIDELYNSKKSVQILRHRFNNGFCARKYLRERGEFCVQFNTFLNNAAGREVLSDWKKQTLDCCSFESDGKTFGDQMYLNEWPGKYDCVYINDNPGAGIAPWNINRYRFYSKEKNEFYLLYDKDKKKKKVIFYHFHGIDYLERYKVNIHVFLNHFRVDEKVLRSFYDEYLFELEECKMYLEKKYGIVPLYTRDITRDKSKENIFIRIMIRLKEGYFKHPIENIEVSLKYRLGKIKDIVDIEKMARM